MVRLVWDGIVMMKKDEPTASKLTDDEKELGTDPIIASLSFGANRDFIFKHKTDRSIENVKLHLKSGSLLLMLGSTQHYWKHSLPKRLKVKEPRINLTFRNIIQL